MTGQDGKGCVVLNSEQEIVKEANIENRRRRFRRKWVNLRPSRARQAEGPRRHRNPPHTHPRGRADRVLRVRRKIRGLEVTCGSLLRRRRHRESLSEWQLPGGWHGCGSLFHTLLVGHRE